MLRKLDKKISRIAHIEYGFTYPPFGGEQLRVSKVCGFLLEKFDIKLFYPSSREAFIKDKPDFEIEKFEYKYKESKQKRLFWKEKKSINNISIKLKEYKPDIIHHHFGAMPTLINVVIAGKKIEIPQMVTFHQFWPLCYRGIYWDFNGNVCNKENVCGRCMLTIPLIDKLMNLRWRKTVKWILSSINHCVTYSKFMKKKLYEAGIKDDEISVIPYGVDFENVPSENFKREFVIFSGRLSLEKGVDLFIKAVSRIRNNGFKTVIIGDGPQRTEYENLVKKLELNIHFTGWLNDRNEYFQYLKRGICVVVPSLWIENFPLVIGEAFACETPVIGSNSGGIPELINESGAGFVVERDPDEIAEKIKILIEDEKLREELGKRGRVYAEEHFRWEGNVEKLIKVYEKVLEEKR